jgi:mannose/fructose/N-acetylgalactosamine-specific phosphotransferase system component IIC
MIELIEFFLALLLSVLISLAIYGIVMAIVRMRISNEIEELRRRQENNVDE